MILGQWEYRQWGVERFVISESGKAGIYRRLCQETNTNNGFFSPNERDLRRHVVTHTGTEGPNPHIVKFREFLMPPIQIHMPALPSPPSWFPGHMRKFTRILPALLKRTDIVLEIRDSRLPLTSINKQLEGMSVNL